MPTDDVPDPSTLDALRAEYTARLEEVDSRLAALDARLAALGGTPAAPTATGPSEVERADPPLSTATDPRPSADVAQSGQVEGPNGPRRTDRRALLRSTGVAAVGGVVAGVAAAVVDAAPAAAAYSTTGNPALLGTASPAGGTGVKGDGGSNGTGVYGLASDNLGTGVLGDAGGTGNATGVLGRATGTQGTGVVGEGSPLGVGIAAYGGRAPLYLYPVGILPTASTVAHASGELYTYVTATTASLWTCVASGTPGTWRKLAGSDTAGALHVLPKPVRVYDSRPGNPPATGPKTPLGGGVARAVDTKGNASGVPAGASAVLVNLTVVNTSASGNLALYANGITNPGTSSINWDHVNEIVANTTLTGVDTNAVCQAYVPANSACDFLLDVLGYYL